MATLIIPDLDEAVRDRLRARAEERGHSLEEEAREILEGAIGAGGELDAAPGSGAQLVAELRAIFADMGGVDLPQFPDQPFKPRSTFGDDLEDDA